MPPNTKSVCRPGPWGNPHRVGPELSAAEAVARFEADLARNPELVERARAALSGSNLACYCPRGAPCHRDVWGRLLNKDWTP